MDSLFEMPRYEANPVLFLFESLILDRIGYLPEQAKSRFTDLDFANRLGDGADTWQEAVFDLLDLPASMDITIHEKWYSKLEETKMDGKTLDPISFAQDFADQYFNSESGVKDAAGIQYSREELFRVFVLRSMNEN